MENTQLHPTPQGTRPYEKPKMEVIILPETPQLLAQSGGANRGDYTPTKW